MASFTLTDSQLFPAGTVVGVWPGRVFAPSPPQRGQGAPPAALKVSEGTVSALGAVTVGGLADGTQYFAGAEVAGVWTWVGFFTALTTVAPGQGVNEQEATVIASSAANAAIAAQSFGSASKQPSSAFATPAQVGTAQAAAEAAATAALAAKANLAGPTFTGAPKAPTAAPGTNSQQLATTAYVDAAVPAAGSVAPAQILSSLDQTARAEAVRSVARARQAYDDAAAIVNLWANLTDNGATLAEAAALTVAGGEVLGTNKAKPWLGIPFAVNNGNFRLVTRIQLRTGGTAGKFAFVGVSSNATSPITVVSAWTAIGVDGTGEAVWFVKGSAGKQLATGLTAGNYLCTVVGDENGVSLTLQKSDRSVEVRAFATRAEVGEVKQIVLDDEDARGATGVTIGALGARQSLGTITPRAGIEDQGVCRSVWTRDKNGERIRLELPTAFDSRTPPVAWLIHSHSLLTEAAESEKAETQTLETAGGVQAATYKALLEAGFATAASRMHQNSYGNAQSQTDLIALYEYIRDHYPMAPIVLMGYSGGATAALMATVQRKIPVAAVCLVSGFTNLGWYNGVHASAPQNTLNPTFEAAYGVNAGFTNFAAQVTNLGLDPQTHAAPDFRGVPVGIFASPADALVPKANNGDELAAKLEAGASQRQLVRVSTTGEHGTAGNWNAAEVKAFVEGAVLL